MERGVRQSQRWRRLGMIFVFVFVASGLIVRAAVSMLIVVVDVLLYQNGIFDASMLKQTRPPLPSLPPPLGLLVTHAYAAKDLSRLLRSLPRRRNGGIPGQTRDARGRKLVEGSGDSSR